GTKKECTEKAGELIDILAPGGKYIFSWNKTPMGLGDAMPENISAVTKFVRENGVY
ncbi:MAG: uroporphyrinogen decarboxylase, partial [Spirochaetes bacterium]